jgi:hypothetical protein
MVVKICALHSTHLLKNSQAGRFLRLPASHNGAIAEVAASGELAATEQVTPVPESQTSTRLAVLPSSSFLPTASNAANKSEF